eukprot:1363055-Amorphochlora_amoeboformis.AAC.1
MYFESIKLRISRCITRKHQREGEYVVRGFELYIFDLVISSENVTFKLMGLASVRGRYAREIYDIARLRGWVSEKLDETEGKFREK